MDLRNSDPRKDDVLGMGEGGPRPVASGRSWLAELHLPKVGKRKEFYNTSDADRAMAEGAEIIDALLRSSAEAQDVADSRAAAISALEAQVQSLQTQPQATVTGSPLEQTEREALIAKATAALEQVRTEANDRMKELYTVATETLAERDQLISDLRNKVAQANQQAAAPVVSESQTVINMAAEVAEKTKAQAESEAAAVLARANTEAAGIVAAAKKTASTELEAAAREVQDAKSNAAVLLDNAQMQASKMHAQAVERVEDSIRQRDDLVNEANEQLASIERQRNEFAENARQLKSAAQLTISRAYQALDLAIVHPDLTSEELLAMADGLPELEPEVLEATVQASLPQLVTQEPAQPAVPVETETHKTNAIDVDEGETVELFDDAEGPETGWAVPEDQTSGADLSPEEDAGWLAPADTTTDTEWITSDTQDKEEVGTETPATTLDGLDDILLDITWDDTWTDTEPVSPPASPVVPSNHETRIAGLEDLMAGSLDEDLDLD